MPCSHTETTQAERAEPGMLTQWQLPPFYSVLDPLLGERKHEKEGDKLQGGFASTWSGVRQSTGYLLSHLYANEEMEIPPGHHLVDQQTAWSSIYK